MTIVTVACGKKRLKEALNLVKSLVMFSQCRTMTIMVFLEAQDMREGQTRLTKLIEAKLFRKVVVRLSILEAVYPQGVQAADGWKNLFKNCASFRLFLPVKLTPTDNRQADRKTNR